MRAPAGLVAVPLCAGIWAGLLLFEDPDLARLAAWAALLALLAALAAHLAASDGGPPVCVAAAAACAGLSLGASGALEAYEPPLLVWFRAITPDGPVSLEGRLVEDAARGIGGISLHVRVSGVTVANAPSLALRGGVKVSVAGDLAPARMHQWLAGRTVRLTASLREPAVYLNPGVPDDTRALARRGIVLVGSVKSAALVEVTAPAGRVAESTARCRQWVRQTLGTFVGPWGKRSAGIATAILIGDRTGLNDQDERRLQDAGTYHVVAISGGNIAILTAGLLGVLRLLGIRGRTAAALVIVLLLAYGQVVVAAASVGRAISAAVIFLAGRLLDHRGPSLNILSVAAIGALAVAPVAAFDPGFILSFGATLGILAGAPPLIQRMGVCAVWRLPAGLLAATIAAEAWLLPAAAVIFQRVTVAGLIANFAAIPLMSVVQAASLCLLALAELHRASAPAAAFVVHAAATGLVESARIVDVAPWLARQVQAPDWWLIAAYYVALLCATLTPRLRRPGACMTLVAAAAVMWGGPPVARDATPGALPGWMRVAFLDVGQGDATLLMLPDGRAYLVDAGGSPIPALHDGDVAAGRSFDIGERVVAPALRALGVRRLDTLVLTHGDPDHIGGAPSIAREFRPRAFWEGVPVPPHPGLAALQASADASRAEWRSVRAGDALRIGPVRIVVLHPPQPEWERQRVRNEDSIVLQVRFGDVSIVLPGDIGREGEAAAANFLEPAPIAILKAAHHGSATSSTSAFIQALRPDAVIVSAGRRNHFGHPAPAVISRFRAAGAALFSTAEDGAVIVDTDGRSVELTSWKGRRITLRAGR